MCYSGRGFVVGSCVPFWKGGGRQLCAFLLGDCWCAFMCLSGRVLEVGSYMLFWRGLVVGSYLPFR
jgi:hypothetical protein